MATREGEEEDEEGVYQSILVRRKGEKDFSLLWPLTQPFTKLDVNPIKLKIMLNNKNGFSVINGFVK